MAKKKSRGNYLDNIPLRNENLLWDERGEDGVVTVTIPHTGFFDKLAQQIFHKPVHSRIDLDTFGSFIWKRIDGENSVYDISQEVKETFGDAAEPLYNRIVAFFEILKSHKFIAFTSQKK